MQLSTGIETQKERTLAMLEDKEFMCWLFERYGRFIWYTVKKFCRRTDLWEDIVQESLLRLLSCTPRLRKLSEQKLAGYIAVTTRNTTYALLWKEEKNRENCMHLFGVHRHSRGWTRAGGDHPSKRADRSTRESMLGLA